MKRGRFHSQYAKHIVARDQRCIPPWGRAVHLRHPLVPFDGRNVEDINLDAKLQPPYVSSESERLLTKPIGFVKHQCTIVIKETERILRKDYQVCQSGGLTRLP